MHFSILEIYEKENLQKKLLKVRWCFQNLIYTRTICISVCFENSEVNIIQKKYSYFICKKKIELHRHSDIKNINSLIKTNSQYTEKIKIQNFVKKSGNETKIFSLE